MTFVAIGALRAYFTFQEAEEIPGLRRLPVYRLDEGKGQFRRRWGYETLEIIKENAIQHSSTCKFPKWSKSH